MKKLLFILVFISSVLITNAKNGIINVKSDFSAAETSSRLVNILNEKGMTVFAIINHTEGAVKVEKKLRPTILIIFGNPKVGTPLMQANQLTGLDLPQKALIWEDENGIVWISYNDPKYLEKRHGLKKNRDIIKKTEKALKTFTELAAKKEM